MFPNDDSEIVSVFPSFYLSEVRTLRKEIKRKGLHEDKNMKTQKFDFLLKKCQILILTWYFDFVIATSMEMSSQVL